ncbi:MAG: hypothetical protein EOP47_01360 [Sphingobacteriaceae bacterium]|nr:MAG: hypothetical protein EOP47_01360 [Sphingobacteriaceae bacterium]
MVSAQQIKKNISMIFLFVFFAKMVISVMPLFSFLDSKLAVAVILQLEHENKSDKDDFEKDFLKEKKSFDEHTLSAFEFKPLALAESGALQTLENTLLVRPFHPVVPTPPPNV